MANFHNFLLVRNPIYFTGSSLKGVDATDKMRLCMPCHVGLASSRPRLDGFYVQIGTLRSDLIDHRVEIE